MKYISTRGQAEPVSFSEAVLAGLAPNGGLYVPQDYPSIAPARKDEPYVNIAARVLSAFAGDEVSEADMLAMCERAYATFSHHSVAPLTQIGSGRWMMELHHGPTLAFKDVAMQIISQLYDHFLAERKQRLSIVCATSGDTGGAAAAAFAGSQHADLFILHPHGRVSPVQRLFMTTSGADNVFNFAVDGDFDDCQAIVKSMFKDAAFAKLVGLSGVNSINWARIAAQSVYYAATAAQFDGPVRFVVPSGNMGDALAGYIASKCGLLPDLQIVCAVNENDALARLLNDGVMARTSAVATPSPAMDISVPSNFERLLFDATGRNADELRAVYDRFAQSGEATLPGDAVAKISVLGISARAVSNAETMSEIDRVYGETGWLICPHTAVGTHMARQLPAFDGHTVVLATAAAAKFPETVEEAAGVAPILPERAEVLRDRGEVFQQLPADVSRVRMEIEKRATRHA